MAFQFSLKWWDVDDCRRWTGTSVMKFSVAILGKKNVSEPMVVF